MRTRIDRQLALMNLAAAVCAVLAFVCRTAALACGMMSLACIAALCQGAGWSAVAVLVGMVLAANGLLGAAALAGEARQGFCRRAARAEIVTQRTKALVEILKKKGVF